jgi:hypothetical protein
MMDYEADERLLRHSLTDHFKKSESRKAAEGRESPESPRAQEPPLHIRRTLDQSYFLTLDDTSERDRDQVVYRETKSEQGDPARPVSRVVMVDQLWLWILDERRSRSSGSC